MQHGDRFLAVRSLQDLMPLIGEQIRERFTKALIIVNDKDGWHSSDGFPLWKLDANQRSFSVVGQD